MDDQKLERIHERIAARDAHLREAKEHIDAILSGQMTVDGDSDSFAIAAQGVAEAEGLHVYVRGMVPEIPASARQPLPRPTVARAR